MENQPQDTELGRLCELLRFIFSLAKDNCAFKLEIIMCILHVLRF